MNKFITSLPVSCLLFSSLFGSEGEAVKSCTTGHYVVPPSQQPGLLIGFGDTIIPKNDVQVFFSVDSLINEYANFVDVIPSVIYGITDTLTLYTGIPFTPRYKQRRNHSSGIEDIFAQLEYAFYVKEGHCYNHQFTALLNVTFPTGSTRKYPPTGFGAMTYFPGLTYSYIDDKWLIVSGIGALIPTERHGMRFGNSYLYQMCLGRNFATPGGWCLDWLVEVDGAFSEKDKIHGSKNPNSGGNVIYVTPSLWASSNKWTVQVGLGYAVYQHLFGHQNRKGFLFSFVFGQNY